MSISKFETSIGFIMSTSNTAALPSKEGLQFKYWDSKVWVLDPLVTVRVETANTANSAIGAALEKARGEDSSSSGGGSGGGDGGGAAEPPTPLHRELL